jgi:hypothetical protein
MTFDVSLGLLAVAAVFALVSLIWFFVRACSVRFKQRYLRFEKLILITIRSKFHIAISIISIVLLTVSLVFFGVRISGNIRSLKIKLITNSRNGER